MPYYGNKSSINLNTAETDLVVLFNEVIKEFDNSIIYGHRSAELQFELFKKGRRENANGEWVIINKKKVVTFKDGIKKLSRHNKVPSEAVDAAPYPIDWDDTNRMYYFAGFVMATAKSLKREGRMTDDITWGGDWDGDTEVDDQTFMDLVHFQTKK